MLEKIDNKLEHWARGNWTIKGQKLIVQMVVGGMTQYLTVVQGMPCSVEKRLMVRKFILGDKILSPVKKETRYAPLSKGGRAVLDTAAQNEAIGIIWLKSYSDFSTDRPTWTLVADALFTEKVPATERSVSREVQCNIFMQELWIRLHGKAAPQSMCSLLETSKRFGARIEGLSFLRDILQSMPIWYHWDADPKIRRLNHSKASKCLRTNHNINPVEEMECLAAILNNREHVHDANCLCTGCTEVDEQNIDCDNPHECILRAGRTMDTLPKKWNPEVNFVENE